MLVPRRVGVNPNNLHIFLLVGEKVVVLTSNINDQNSGWSVLLRRYVLKGTLSPTKNWYGGLWRWFYYSWAKNQVVKIRDTYYLAILRTWPFWDGENVTQNQRLRNWPPTMGIKRSRLESPGTGGTCNFNCLLHPSQPFVPQNRPAPEDMGKRTNKAPKWVRKPEQFDGFFSLWPSTLYLVDTEVPMLLARNSEKHIGRTCTFIRVEIIIIIIIRALTKLPEITVGYLVSPVISPRG